MVNPLLPSHPTHRVLEASVCSTPVAPNITFRTSEHSTFEIMVSPLFLEWRLLRLPLVFIRELAQVASTGFYLFKPLTNQAPIYLAPEPTNHWLLSIVWGSSSQGGIAIRIVGGAWAPPCTVLNTCPPTVGFTSPDWGMHEHMGSPRSARCQLNGGS